MAGLAAGLTRGEDGVVRCSWAGADPLYQRYHDHEWGLPQLDDTRLFEKVCLEGFQAGLSWLTILRKRENFRRGFAGFDIAKVARFAERDILRLLGDEGIVRHRGKIESAINNAQRALEMRKAEGSLHRFFWSWEPPDSERPKKMTHEILMRQPTTLRSVALGRELKRRGWTFVGGTTVYAFMQAVGLVDDHLHGCDARPGVEAARSKLVRPATAPASAASRGRAATASARPARTRR